MKTWCLYPILLTSSGLLLFVARCILGLLTKHPPKMRAIRSVPRWRLAVFLPIVVVFTILAFRKGPPLRTDPDSPGDQETELRFTSIAVSSNSVSLEVAWPTNMFTLGTTLDLFHASTYTGCWEWVESVATLASSTSHVFSVVRTNADTNGFFRVSDRSSCATSMADADGDGIPDVYELANGTNPYVSDYAAAPKILAGVEGGASNLAAALAESVPYSIIEIAPGVHGGNGWTGLHLPAHPVLITSPDGGRSRACTLRDATSAAVFYLDATQRTETVVQGLNIDLLATSNIQMAFWCGGNLPLSGLPAAGTFRNLSIRMPNPGADYCGWFIRHWESNEVVIASCVVNAAGATRVRGIAAVDSPPMSVENCTFVNFPPAVSPSLGYGVQYESTETNNGGAPDRIPVEIVNCVFDSSFTNAYALAPLEEGVDYEVTMMNSIVPSPLEYLPDVALGVCVTNALVSWSGHILAGSPAIDFGTDALRSPFDVDGQNRVGRPDAGADERVDLGARDTDGDGLTDTDEINQHGTDPFRADSDFDGTPDGDEIATGTDPVNPASYLQTLSVVVTNTASTSIPTYVAWGYASTGWETNGLTAFPSGSGTFAYTNDAAVGVAYVKAFTDINDNGECDEGVDLMLVSRRVAQVHNADISFTFGDMDGDGVSDAQERVDGTDPCDARSFRLTCTVNLLPCGRSAWLTNFVAWGHVQNGWETNGVAAFSTVTNYEFAVDGIATNGFLYAKVFRDLDTNGVYNAGVDALTAMKLVSTNIGGRVDLRFGDRNGNGIPDWWEARKGLNAEGVARRMCDDPDGDGLVNLHEYWMDTDPLVPDGSNTLLSVATRSIDERIANVDPVASVPRFENFLANASNGMFIANTNFWARDLDLSCVSVWHTNSVPESKTATLITRRHVVLAHHWYANNGLYTFCDTNGLVCTRKLQKVANIFDDLLLGRLDEPLPESFKTAYVAPTNFASRLVSGRYLPTLCINHAKAATVLELVSLDCHNKDNQGRHHWHYGNTSWTNLVSSQRCEIRGSTVDGMSSSPVFIVAGSNLVLLFTKHLGWQNMDVWWPSWGPMLPFGLNTIQNTINTWEGANAHQYQITPFDLSQFPETVNQ